MSDLITSIPWQHLGVSLIIIVCGWIYWRDERRDED